MPLTIGQGAASQGAFTGVFQNRFMPSANAIWIKGKHTITFGGSWSHTQLNTRDQRTGQGIIGFADFSQFLQGLVTPYSTNGFIATAFLSGNANRYYRANESGEYIEDKFQLRNNLSVTAGLRWDYNGGLTEKNGEPSITLIRRNTITTPPLRTQLPSRTVSLLPGTIAHATKGVSNSTLDRQAMGARASPGRGMESQEV